MKRKLIFTLILVSAVGLIVYCGGGGSGGPDLSGTWDGTGWVDTEFFELGPQMESLSAVPLGPPPPLCPTEGGLVDLELVMASDGTPTDLLICGDSVDTIMGTAISAVVDQADFRENVLWVIFSTTVTEEDVFMGGLVLDDSNNYAVVFLWDTTTDEDIVYGVLQRTTGSVAYSEPAMVGSWSGIAVDFEEIEEVIYYEKNSPLDITLFTDSSLALTGTDPDGLPLSGSVTLEDSDYGYVEGTVTATIDDVEVDFDLEGFVSPDGEFFGGGLDMVEGTGSEWAIIGLTKEEVLE